MARKRIKTLASEWNVPVDDVLHSCERLKLAHARSDSSLLAPDEADRVKADLDEQAHRAAILRREKVLDTTAGKVVEKRITSNVMRRRHAEPGPGDSQPMPSGEPFHFETEQKTEETFVAPFLEEPPPPLPDDPVGFEVEPEVNGGLSEEAAAPLESESELESEPASEQEPPSE